MLTNIYVLLILSFSTGGVQCVCTEDDQLAVAGCGTTFSDGLSTLSQGLMSGMLSMSEACLEIATLYHKATECLSSYQQKCAQDQSYTSILSAIEQGYEQVMLRLQCDGTPSDTCSVAVTSAMSACVSVFGTNVSALSNAMTSGSAVTPDGIKTFCVALQSLFDKTIKCLDSAAAGHQACGMSLGLQKNAIQQSAAMLNKTCANSTAKQEGFECDKCAHLEVKTRSAEVMSVVRSANLIKTDTNCKQFNSSYVTRNTTSCSTVCYSTAGIVNARIFNYSISLLTAERGCAPQSWFSQQRYVADICKDYSKEMVDTYTSLGYENTSASVWECYCNQSSCNGRNMKSAHKAKLVHSISQGLVTVPAANTPNMTIPNLNTANLTLPTVISPNVTVPTVNTPSATVPTLNTPNGTTPTVNPPNVTVPTVNTANVTTPTVHTPNVTVPTVNTANVTTSTVHTPNVTVPTANTPNATLPTKNERSATVPTLNTPNVTVPNKNEPSVTVPTLNTPNATVQTVNTSTTVPPQTTPTKGVTTGAEHNKPVAHLIILITVMAKWILQ